jgi:hypothetical protein
MDNFTDISLYAISGQRLPFEIIKNKDNELTIDIGKFPSGIYYIKLHSAKQSFVKSFIVK